VTAMRRLLPFIAIAVVLSASAPLFAQEWMEFTSTADFFTANFPGQPVVTETPWKSEYGAYLPAHAYTVKKGPAVYSMEKKQ
jgi:hypothetical protein